MSKLNNFSLCRKRCTTTINPHSPYDPTNLVIHSILLPEDDLKSKCGPSAKKTAGFDDVVNFIDEEDVVIYVNFDCGITLFPEPPSKLDRSTENGITFPDPLKNPKTFPATINIPVLSMNSITLISF